ncbi:DNA methyltransferase [Lysobacter terrae]
MPLLEQLSKILANGRQKAERVLLAASDDHPGTRLHTLECVLPIAQAATVGGIARPRLKAPPPEQWSNRLIRGDNLPAMAALLAGDEDTPSLRGRIDLIYVDPPAASQADYRVRVALPVAPGKRQTVISPFAYSDMWPDGVASYLQAIVPRLVLMRELLTESGSILCHVGGPVSHYLRIVLDEIFGKENFVQDVIWSHGPQTAPVHACIAHYANARHRRHGADAHLHDVRTESSSGRKADAEITGYGQQKPERLLERIVEYACPDGGLVADFYAGAGTIAVAAERLGRRWIAADAGALASTIARKRLIGAKAKPFLYQTIDPRIGTSHPPSIHDFATGDLVEKVLSTYGAVPLPSADDPMGNLGASVCDAERTLVRVEPPDRVTGRASLDRAIAQFQDGWKHVVVLGWNFEPSLGDTLLALGRDDLDVLAVQPGALDKAGEHDGSRQGRKGRFRSLRSLRVEPVRRERASYRDSIGDSRDTEIIDVVLDHFAVLSPETVDLVAGDRPKLASVMAADPLALIEYWSVDPDYDGTLFRSVWQEYRGGAGRVTGIARFDAPYKNAQRRVCVRAVDVFGVETEVVLSVAVPGVSLQLPGVREEGMPLAREWLTHA